MKLILDIETNGLLDELHTCWCIVLREPGGEVWPYGPKEIDHALAQAQQADELIGHGLLTFDLPALRLLFDWRFDGKITDTLVYSRFVYPDIGSVDARLEMPKHLKGRHKLEAWGHRLKCHKGSYNDWSRFSQEMLDYCIQDTAVTEKVYEQLEKQRFPREALDLEQDFSVYLEKQRAKGVLVDKGVLDGLVSRLLSRRAELVDEWAEIWQGWWEPYETEKRKDKKLRWKEFNPNSTHHLVRYFREEHKWQPKEFTPTGLAKMDEEVLATIPCPEARLAEEWELIKKRLGQVAEGKQNWLKYIKEDGRIHGRVNHNGTITGRCSHARPNLAQVPANRKPYGEECRSAFVVPSGFVLVGADASGLELRCLAHYLAEFDGGAYTETVLRGDPHQLTMEAVGLTDRDQAKTFFYALIYGAGFKKLGQILGAGSKEGKAAKASMMSGIAGFGDLVSKLEKRLEAGWVEGPVGTKVRIRSRNGLLNTLLQHAGAVVMKTASVILDQRLQAEGLVPGVDENYRTRESYDYAPVLHVHDEVQIETKERLGELVGQTAVGAIRDAGVRLNFRCPLDGEYAVGNSWAETH